MPGKKAHGARGARGAHDARGTWLWQNEADVPSHYSRRGLGSFSLPGVKADGALPSRQFIPSYTWRDGIASDVVPTTVGWGGWVGGRGWVRLGVGGFDVGGCGWVGGWVDPTIN